MPCCSFQRRYERYILKVYPTVPGEAINTAALGQLTFYALSQRNMLPKIGKFTARKITHDVNRSRLERVACGVQIFQALLDSCHSELKLFSEPFLRTVCGLLETNTIEYQQLAVQSFQKFALIEEETTAYQRHYDTLVSMFSSMCWKMSNPIIRKAGLEGIKAIFQKALVKGTASLWEETHLSLILPALLNNIKSTDFADPVEAVDDSNGDAEKQLPRIALSSLRELAGRASFGNVKILLRPVFSFMDKYKSWGDEDDFAGLAFRFIMTSIQPQYTHVAVSSLLHHMDSSPRLTAKDKTGIIKVLSSSLTIAADRAIGPSIIEIFNTLLRHLRLSAEKETGADAQDEVRFQQAIVENCGEFANHLNDTQKVDILTFILSKIPTTVPRSKSSLLRCLVSVAKTYRTSALRNALPEALLGQLLAVILDNDLEVRELGLETFQLLLTCVRSRSSHDNIPQASKSDIQFLREKSESILWHLFSACRKTQQVQHLRRLEDIAVILATEYGTDQMLDTIRMVLALQTTEDRSSLLFAAFNVAHFKRLATLRGYNPLITFVDAVIVQNPVVIEYASHLVPAHLFAIAASAPQQQQQDAFSAILFDASAIATALGGHVDLVDVHALLSQPYRHMEQLESRNMKLKSRPILLPVDVPTAPADEVKPAVTAPPDFISVVSIKQRLNASESSTKDLGPRDLEIVWGEVGKKQDRVLRLVEILPSPSLDTAPPREIVARPWAPPVLPAIYSF